MRKIIGKYVLIIMIISGLLCLGIFYRFNYEREKSTEIEIIAGIAEQVESILKLNVRRDQGAGELFQEDYLNRAKVVSFIIANFTDNHPTNEQLREYARNVEVDSIYFVDEHGEIISSSEDEFVGINFYERKGLQRFIPLIENSDEDAYYVQEDGYDWIQQKDMIYLGVKPQGLSKGMVQIATSTNSLEEYKKEFSISVVMKNIPTTQYQSVFVVDENSGELLGSSKYDNIGITSEYTQHNIEKLKGYVQNVEVVEVRGIPVLMCVREVGDYLVCVTSEMNVILDSILQQVLIMSGVVIILIIVVVFSLYCLLNHFILHDIEGMIGTINEFATGDRTVKFHVKGNTELSRMAEVLNKVMKTYSGKGEKISNILTMLGSKYGVYEYEYELNQIFFSDNIPEMTGLTPEECEKIIRRYFDDEKAREEMEALNGKVKEGLFISKNGKKFLVERMKSQDTYYAVMRDISEEWNEKEELSNELEQAKYRAERDVLTGLYNRAKIRDVVDELFVQGKRMGVMLLFDLDNFKRVNDEKGHLEGDELLRKFAKILQKQFRDCDIRARIGGDEFAIFLPNEVPFQVLEEKLKHLIESFREELKDYYKDYKVSVSIGAAYVDDTIHSYVDLYKVADMAMYSAKNMGKDRYFIGNGEQVNS